jgi:hypothetical protein
MKTKQTAVEYAFSLILSIDWDYVKADEKMSLLEHFKQMEKEQIIDSFDEGFKYDIYNGGGQQYYNETYNIIK